MRKWVLLITFFSTLNMLFANDESTGSPFSQSKFVPDISLILDSTYAHANRTNEELAYLYRPGFTLIPADEARHGHTETHIENGFTVNYAEIAFYSVVDPYFDLFAVCEFDESNASIEEAYFTTRALPFGFQIKGGKFLSGFGRINEQHAHYWNFVDMPLVNNAFFGESGLREVGVRINWVAPTPFFFSIAFEILRGENPRSFGVEKIFHISGTTLAERQNRPNLYTGNIRTSFDIGNILILAGASAAGGNSQINHGIDRTGQMGSAFLGTTYLFGGDITVKYIFDSQRSIAFQAEYLHRTMKGDNYLNDALSALTAMRTHKKQSGLYAQLVGKFSKRWGFGLRYDLLWKNTITENGTAADMPNALPRYSGMLEYNPTEFSRFRIQYNMDASRYALEVNSFENKVIHELIVQANLAIGAHGAHQF